MGNTSTELPAERLSHCLEMAARARESAALAAFPETREVYTAIAMAWETLAVEVQGMSGTRKRQPSATSRNRSDAPLHNSKLT